MKIFLNAPKSISITLFLLLFMESCVSDMKQDSQKVIPGNSGREILGVKLQPKTLNLLSEIEKSYNKQVCFTTIDKPYSCGKSFLTVRGQTFEATVDFNRSGQSFIATDGTPVIIVSESGKNELTIAHELFHLKYYIKGYPRFVGVVNNKLNRIQVMWFAASFQDEIQHYLFYPQMREIGLDPDLYSREITETVIRNDQWSNAPSGFEDEFRSLEYYCTLMELGGSPKGKEILVKVKDYYKAKKWDKNIEQGNAFAQTVMKVIPDSPQSLVDLTLQGMNELFKNKIKFTQAEWVDNQRISSFSEKLIAYEAHPVN